MALCSKLKELVGISADIIRHRKTSMKLLSQLPALRRGFDYARHDCHPSATAPAAPHCDDPASNPLREFFNARTTGRGVWKWDHYFEIYQRHFGKFVGRDVNILEVGVYSGGSMDMWHHYFGDRARIFGVDIEPACKSYENEFTSILIGDQADPHFWADAKKQIPPIDILIDDGGHQTPQQIVTLEEMFSHIRPGGVYLCEDITGVDNDFAAYVSGFIRNLNHFNIVGPGPNLVAHPCDCQRAIHAIHFYPLVTVIEKADEPVKKFFADKHGTQWQPFL
ncbi:MAG: class I SAM-dependent methyltransferase [Phycisphaerales bacterium]